MATVTYSYSGSMQIFFAPTEGWYRIDAFGAQGGGSPTTFPVSTTLGGLGAEAEGDVYLFAGEQLQIVVGGRGSDSTRTDANGKPSAFSGAGGGGGGGTFVFGVDSSPLVVAGGGGGASLLAPGDPGQATTSGSNGTSRYSSPGLAGIGGAAGGGGKAPTSTTYNNAGGGGGGVSSGGTSEGTVQFPTYGTGGSAIFGNGSGGQGGGAVDNGGDAKGTYEVPIYGGGGNSYVVTNDYSLKDFALYDGGNGGYGGGGGGDNKSPSDIQPRPLLADGGYMIVETGTFAVVYTGGGGGGGGYSGGGGIEYEGGGGGGSFIVPSAQNVNLIAGVESGNGLVTISSNTQVAIEGETLSATIYNTQTIKPYAAAHVWDDPNLRGIAQAAVQLVFDSRSGTFSNYGSATLASVPASSVADTLMVFQGSGSQITEFLRGLVFTPAPNAAKPGQPSTTSIGVRVLQGTEQTDFASSQITVISVQTPPTITGTAAHQVVTADATNTPLSNVTITDTDPYEIETVTITLTDGNGPTDSRGLLESLVSILPITKTGVGTYTVTGSPSFVSTTLDGLRFRPAGGNSTPGQVLTTGITLSVTNAFGVTATDTTTSVDYTYINTRPVITGPSTSTLNATTPMPMTGGTLSAFGAGAVSSTFQPPNQTSLDGTYGAFTFNAATGVWGYTLDENRAATQALLKGQQATDTLTVASLDGQASSIGTNSAPVITNGTTTGQIAELPNTTGATQYNGVGGSFAYTDQDQFDVHAATVNAPSFTWSGGSLTAGQQSALSTALMVVTAVDAFGTGTGSVIWTYGAPDAVFDFLAAGETLSATYGLTLTDTHGAKASQNLVITVAGANDAPTLSGGVTTGAITERAGITGASAMDTAAGSFAFADADRTDTHTASAGTASFGWSGGVLNATQLASLGTGQLTLTTSDQTGTVGWSYGAPDRVFDFLAAGQTLTVSTPVTISDGQGGSAVQTVVVTNTGSNDAASITGSTTGAVSEDGTTTATGVLAVTDPDAGQASFTTPSAATLAGTYGSFTFNPATGAWTYTLNNAAANVQSLAKSQTVSDTLAVTSLDGTASQNIVITVTGTNDAPTISGAAANQPVSDKATIKPFATVTIADIDAGASDSLTITLSNAANGTLSSSGAGLSGANGVYTLAASDPASLTAALRGLTFSPTANQVAPGQTVSTSFSLAANDGKGGTVTSAATSVVATSINDTATIGGSGTGAVAEDGTIRAAGTLTVSDPDPGQASFRTPAAAALAGTYGTFSFTASTGAWSYTLNNAAANVQSLAAGQSVSDNVTVTSLDGTASRVITVTVAGANDAPTIAGAVANQTTTDYVQITPFATTSIGDIDNGAQDSLTITLSNAANGTLTGTGLTGGASGVYTLAATDPATLTSELRALIFTPTANQVAPSQTVTTAFTLSVSDGIATTQNTTTSVAAVSIIDAPVISGTKGGQTTTDYVPIKPFASAVVSDVDIVGPTTTDSVVIKLVSGGTATDATGKLSGAGLTKTGTGTYMLTASSPQALTTALEALSFTPTQAQVKAGQTVTTTFQLTPSESAGGSVATGATDGATSVTVTALNYINGPANGFGLLIGTSGIDVITAHGSNNTIFGNGGNDIIDAGGGSASVTLGNGDANVTLGGGYNSVIGGNGNITITGGSGGYAGIKIGNGNASITIGGGYNTITAGNGNATVTGAPGGHTAVVLGNGNSTVMLGGGYDSVLGGNGNFAVTGGSGGHTTVTLGNGNNTVQIAGTNDVILLGNGTNMVSGTQGNAFITTGSGNDTIILGGSGNTVDAGAGQNSIFGGTGSDVFVLPAAGKGFDAISGFTEANGDVLDLRAALAATNWNHQSKTLANYLKVTDAGGSTNFAIAPTGSGSGTAIASLSGTNYGLADLISHHSVVTI